MFENFMEFMKEWNVYYLVTVVVFLTVHLFTDSSRHMELQNEVDTLKIEIKNIKESNV